MLDRLPWPWGEDILARLFVAKALFRPRRLRRALAWASVSLGGRGGRWRLALSLHANQGRLVARKTLVGFRHPDDLRRHLVVQGQEHVDGVSGGRIFLAFHLGLGGLDGLRALGHRVTALWVPSTLWAWPEKAWRSLDGGGELASPRGDRAAWGSALYQARRALLDGGAIYILADGSSGTEAFRVPLPGGPIIIRSGWIALSRQTGATVLPVLSHLEGYTQVVTIHPALPLLDPDPVRGLESCREALGALLASHVRQFPEQCPTVAFRGPGAERHRGIKE
jgi:lauroyl/myristoyl acyltransferase